MTEESFIIDNMRWSFSRLTAFDQCPYAWRRSYIDSERGIGNAFASYGTLNHEMHEKYYKGELPVFMLSDYYEENYNEAIPEDFPPNKYVDLRQKYYDQGIEYWNNFALDFACFDIIGVEKEVNFEIAGKPFVGYIDLLLQDKETKELTIFDHKSASLSFKKNGDVSKKDEEHLLSFKRQLYMYAKPLIEAGYTVSHLQWNLFRDQRMLIIPFKQEEYEETLKWAEETIKRIEQENMWLPNPDFYFCHYICNHRNFCEYKP